ncbi:MAG: hypothetical protein WD059_15330 [Balneolaceae bacterium]
MNFKLLISLIITAAITLGFYNYDADSKNKNLLHDQAEDIIVNSLCKQLGPDCLTGNIYFIEGGNERGAGRSSGGYTSQIKDTLVLHDVRKKGVTYLRIELDGNKVIDRYNNPDTRPVFKVGTDGLTPSKIKYFVTKRGTSLVYVMELKFERTTVEKHKPELLHVHGHLCDPNDDECRPD